MQLSLLVILVRRHLMCAWNYRWQALAAFWVVGILGVVGVSSIPSQYEVNARIYIDTSAVLTPLLRGLAVESSSLSDLEVIQRTLLSRPNLEKLIAETDLKYAAADQFDRERLVRALARQIRVLPQARNLFAVDYRNTDRDIAYSVVRTIIRIFIDGAAASGRADMEAAQRFLDEQIGVYELQLREAERRRADFRTKYVTILSSDGGGSRVEAARTAQQNLENSLKDSESRRDMLKLELQNTSATLVTESDRGSPGSPTRPGVLEAERALAELRLRYTDRHPDVIAARNRLEALRAGPAVSGSLGGSVARQRSAANPVYQEIKVRLLDAEMSVTTLQRQVGDARAERERIEEIARANPMLEAESQAMDRDYNVLRKSYEELLSRREAARIAAAVNTDTDSKLQIVDPPERPRVPVSPSRRLLMLGVLVAGIGAAFGTALLLVQLDGSFYTVEDLRSLGLPVLGGISLLRQGARRRLAEGLAYSCLAAVSIAAVGCVAFGDLLTRLI